MSNDVKYLSNLCRTPVRGLSEVCRLDVETLFLLGGAFAVSIAVAIQHFYDHGRLVKVMTGDDPLDDDALLAWFKGGPLP